MTRTAHDTTVGVACVGYSFMGKAHSNAWRNVGAFYPDAPRAVQRVLVGRDPRRVDEAAQRYGWQESATDWRAVLERDDIHVVDICTPGHLHAEIAEAALAAGKHVLLEKPLANTVAESEVLVAAAEAAAGHGVLSMVGFNYRRVPALALARELIAAGRLGEVREVRAAYLQDWLVDADAPMAWRLRKEEAGSGALGDLGSHVVDQVQFLLGDTVSWASGHLRTFVTSRPGESGPEDVTVDDAAWATLGMSGGAVASVEVSRMAHGRKNGLALEVYGSEGSLRFELESLNELIVDTGVGGTRILVTESDHPYVGAWWPPGHVLGWDHTFVNQAADLLTCIAEGRAPSPSFAEGARVQRVLAAIEGSAAQSGTCVDVVPAADAVPPVVPVPVPAAPPAVTLEQQS
ncbi:Gfo/Idh/MocA family protein [Nocardioides terrigena]|uniref:Gfo/Idh/MocA family protein n=1 Tax=Nocardioides terrigena TaxID=424797 RepID=UPI001F170703|nr:Gfo/Idh/MocA family oxidoreductase [Nocardioides terrigena]